MFKFLALDRPTTVSKLISKTPQHPDALPGEIIPQWTNLLPSSKLPNRCCPVHTTHFSRGKLGQPIWEFPPAFGFELQNPCNYVPKGYHVLHDRHLQQYWTRKLKQNLKLRGQIDSNERVVCTLKELNQFRQFLYLAYRQELLNQLQQMHYDTKCSYCCSNVQTHLKNIDDFSEKLAIKRTRAELIYDKKINNWRKSIELYNEQIVHIKNAQENRKKQGIALGHQKNLKRDELYFQLLFRRKRKILTLRRNIRERDASLQQRLLNNKRRNLEIKTTMNVEHHLMHYMAYLRERKEKEATLETFLKQMQHNVQSRKEMYKRKHDKLDEELVRRKTRNLTKKYARRSKVALIKTLLRECKKHIWARSPSHQDQDDAMVDQTIERAISAAYAIHTTMGPTTSSTQIIDTASQFALDLRDTPNEPLPQDRLTIRYVADRLRKIMDQIIETSVHDARKLIEQVAIAKSECIEKEEDSLGSSLSSVGSYTKRGFQARSVRNQSKVSMGPVSIVEQYETESFSLKKCKFRPPTPVTSVVSLVECNLRQPEEERSSISQLEVTTEAALGVLQWIHAENYPLFHLAYSQRRYLEGNILKYRMIVQPYVEQRLLAAIDLDRLTTVGYEDDVTGEAKKEQILQRTASALLKFPNGEHQYANALFDSVHLLTLLAIRKVKQFLDTS